MLQIKIGNVQLENNLILAPMAGITNRAFRLLTKGYGCALVCSEMISSHGLLMENNGAVELLKIDERERPISIQLFGGEPRIISEAARIVEARGADIVDINMGCSVKKIIKSGYGAALLLEPKKIARIIEEVKKAINIPLTIKVRLGWDERSINVMEVAKAAESAGVDAITVHGRTRAAGFSGEANWEIVGMVKSEVKIPVIVNGDIKTPEEAIKALDKSKADGVMIGRGCLGRPWLFLQIKQYLETGKYNQDISPEEYKKV
ncbi:MAG: tRNA dihydrouridine synthase DusB, partial [bacterium]